MTAKATEAKAKVTVKATIASLTKKVDAALKANDGVMRAEALADIIGERNGKQIRARLRTSTYKRSSSEHGNSWLLDREKCLMIVEWKANKSVRS